MAEKSAPPAKILLIDDQPANLDVLCRLLEAKGYNISVAASGAAGLKIAARVEPDLILLDVMMPEMDGLETCRQLKQDSQTAPVPIIFITASTMQEDVVAGFRAGGVDYIAKPFREEEVLVRVETQVRLRYQSRALEELAQQLADKNEELNEKNRVLESEMAQRKALKNQLTMISQREAQRWGLEDFIGQSPTIQRIFREIRLMQENATMGVLISGESGTGKELVARAIHFGSALADGPFVPVNCAAFPGELAESLLFGHVKGAFTGADNDHDGYFHMAHGGTLFLDEIGEMPLELQAKLLRVLEDSQVRRIGEKEGRKVVVRVLAATNIDLQQQIQAGSFRRDLYFRLARFTVVAPPLRQRQEDIPLLAEHFLHLFASEMGCEPPALSDAVVERLQQYDFPGNVRELKNVIERALIESGGGEISLYHLHFVPMSISGGQPEPKTDFNLPLNLERASEVAELWVVRQAIEQCGGNVSEAARLLGSNRSKVYRVLAQEKKEAS